MRIGPKEWSSRPSPAPRVINQTNKTMRLQAADVMLQHSTPNDCDDQQLIEAEQKQSNQHNKLSVQRIYPPTPQKQKTWALLTSSSILSGRVPRVARSASALGPTFSLHLITLNQLYSSSPSNNPSPQSTPQ